MRSIHQRDLASGRQQDFALRGADDAAVFNVRANQVDVLRGIERAGILDRTGLCVGQEVQPALAEILIRDIEEEAIRPLTSTLLFGPNRMPLGLTRKTRPLERSAP